MYSLLSLFDDYEIGVMRCEEGMTDNVPSVPVENALKMFRVCADW